MPELPEVQTTVDDLNRYVVGLKITGIWSIYDSSYHQGKKNIKNRKFFYEFEKAVMNRAILSASRRAKNVLIHLSGDLTILVHMKMTGHFLYGKYERKTGSITDTVWQPIEPEALKDPYNRFIRLMFALSDGKYLAFSDMRKFAKITYFQTSEIASNPELSRLGPEPLDKKFTFGKYLEQIKKRPQAAIKKALMDQKIISGIGNIYSDEILWTSAVHPESKVKNIPELVHRKIFNNIKKILIKGINFRGDSASDFRTLNGEKGRFQKEHRAYRRAGMPCPKKACGGKIERKIVGARSAHFCNRHQIKWI